VLLGLAVDGALLEEHGVAGEDLDNACLRAGVRTHSGDALVVRGGEAGRLGYAPDDGSGWLFTPLRVCIDMRSPGTPVTSV
jgi:hypothetical protein